MYNEFKAGFNDFEGVLAIPAVRKKGFKRFFGGLVDNDGHEIVSAKIVRGMKEKPENILSLGDDADLINTEPKSSCIGGFCYLGGFSWHYGHFLLEGLSRIPVSKEARKEFGFFFHDLTNGRSNSHIKFFLEKLDVSAFPITSTVFFDGTVRVPQSRFVIRSSVDRDQKLIYQEIKDKVLEGSKGPNAFSHCRKVYLSRSKLVNGKRELKDEKRLESFLVRKGFSVVHMQEHSIQDQVSIMANADVIVGVEGTAMHNIVFSRSEAVSVILSTQESVNGNFILVDKVLGRNSVYLDSKSGIFFSDGSLNLDVLDKALGDFL